VNYADDGFDSAGVGTKGVTVDLLNGRANDNWGASDSLANIENVTGSSLADKLTGDASRNVLSGGLGDDAMNGGDGDDGLIGGAGNDTLKGGAGADSFAFTTALGGGNVDTVADFVSGTDHIELAKSIFTALGVGTLSSTAFAQAMAATTAAQHILYNATTGVVSYDADGNGAVAAVAFATLTPGRTLTAGDFKVV
jgi:serralysin